MRRFALPLALIAAACDPGADEPAKRLDPVPAPAGAACAGDGDCAEGSCVAGRCLLEADDEPLAWSAPAGPASLGVTTDLLVRGDDLAVATYFHVLVSRDGGETWSAGPAFDGTRMDDLVAVGSDLYMRNAFGELFRSTDWGGSWSPSGNEPVDTVHTLDDEAWFLGVTEEAGVPVRIARYTADGGKTFERIDDFPTAIFPGEELLLGRLPSGEVHVSHDRGRTWEAFPVPDGLAGAEFVVWDGSIFGFVREELDGRIPLVVWASHDGGETWDASQRIDVPAGSLDRFELTDDGLYYVSSRGGLAWLPEPEGAWVQLLDGDFNGLIASAAHGSDAGLFRVVRGALERWDPEARASVPVGALPAAGHVRALATDGPTSWAIVDGQSVHRSRDGGRTWSRCAEPAWNTGVAKRGYDDLTSIHARDGSVWVGTFWYGLWRSDDGCESWTPLTHALPSYSAMNGEAPRAVVSMHENERGLFVCTGGMEHVPGTQGSFVSTSVGVLRSEDGGASWQAARSGLPRAGANGAGELFSPCGALLGADEQLFVSLAEGVFRSADGATWSEIEGAPKAGAEEPAMTSVVATGAGLLASFAVMPTEGSGLYASADGASWEPFGGSAPGEGVVGRLRRYGERLVALTHVFEGAQLHHQELWASLDDGATWERLAADEALASGRATLLGGGDDDLLLPVFLRGIWRLPLDRLRLPISDPRNVR